MGSKCKSMKTLSNRCLLRLSEKQSLGVSSSMEHPFPSQRWKFYCSLCPRQLGKIRNLDISHSFNLSSPSHSFSSFSFNSSSSKNGFMGRYLGKLHSRPLITKSITSSLIYVAADLTSQIRTLSYLRNSSVITVTSHIHVKDGDQSSIDSMRMLCIAAYGMLMLGPSQHLWFNSVSKVLPKQDVLTTLKKLFIGQAVYGPSITSIFFSYNAALQGENAGEIIARLKHDLLPTLVRSLLFWPISNFFTYKFTPAYLQPLVNSSCSYVWTIYLTYMASLEKVETEQIRNGNFLEAGFGPGTGVDCWIACPETGSVVD
ncbi:PXMP2/4 family protein 4 [Melia azedarach]|uniref:PXMP2/4 family protein 4 n=1 Tax=Melia azedarach TaxID=155640 RepID=A0ACC1WUR2_MELAZ|nr:PXMP2/4 family protein 4 [Melia azedarach]